MKHLNIEIKAKCSDQDKIRKILNSHHADFKGTDHQIDTYFNVNSGRLKLREGNIENHLVYYERENIKGPKESSTILFDSDPRSSLKEILSRSLGQLVIVDKKREIYYLDNVKFHLDVVSSLGTFVEIEAADKDGKIGRQKLLEQCNRYLELFGVKKKDLLADSYSDMLMKKK